MEDTKRNQLAVADECLLMSDTQANRTAEGEVLSSMLTCTSGVFDSKSQTCACSFSLLLDCLLHHQASAAWQSCFHQSAKYSRQLGVQLRATLAVAVRC